MFLIAKYGLSPNLSVPACSVCCPLPVTSPLRYAFLLMPLVRFSAILSFRYFSFSLGLLLF